MIKRIFINIFTFFRFILLVGDNYTYKEILPAFKSFFKFCHIWKDMIILDPQTNECIRMTKPWKYTCLLGRVIRFMETGHLQNYPMKDGYSSQWHFMFFTIEPVSMHVKNYTHEYTFIDMKHSGIPKYFIYTILPPNQEQAVNSFLISEKRDRQLSKLI